MSVLAGVNRCALLHEGGEAQVYALESDGKKYVLKWYADGVQIDSRVVEALLRERIPGVYRLMEAGKKAGRHYLVYEFIEGVSVADLASNPPAGNLPAGPFAAKDGCVPAPVAISLVRNLAQSLAQLSKNDVHHGDLSPSNVLVTADAAPVLIDCGIVGPGALAYAAPERIQGKPATVKSDMYSLGLLLYRLVAGEDLLHCDCFDGFAQAAAEIDAVDVTALLYGKGMDAEILSTLAPLWKATLRADPAERAEDFEELDELFEIAFDAASRGSVTWETIRDAFTKNIAAKIGTNCRDAGAECGLPPEFAVTKPTGHRKFAVFAGVLGFILFVLVLFFALAPRQPSIDETGAKILSNSRSLEGATGLVADSSGDAGRISGEVLESLPVPEQPE
ncbi:Serine/threonine protein kinase [Fibrobacter sp. UWCM]|uniref:protein kinase domain-containing protein n=1 Tax=Fibrobacter sp. UWCM TaxID=1896208 RepID=UPI00091F4433|nr:protein kinase [Fibrobacter sp. UWCM]SHG45827.1 Serine/threonine protein kinase [Fibrobacter sp. UWCM]